MSRAFARAWPSTVEPYYCRPSGYLRVISAFACLASVVLGVASSWIIGTIRTIRKHPAPPSREIGQPEGERKKTPPPEGEGASLASVAISQ